MPWPRPGRFAGNNDGPQGSELWKIRKFREFKYLRREAILGKALGEKTVKSAGESGGAAAKGPSISIAQALAHAARQHEAGQLEEAEQGYRKVLTVERANADGLQLLGVLRHQQGDSDEAIRLIKEALKRDPRNPRCRNNLGSVLFALDRLEEAEKHFREAVRLDSGCAEFHANLGILLRKLGKVDEATESLDTALRADPNFSPANRELGGIWLDKREFDRVEKYFRAYLELVPSDAETTSNLGYAVQQLGRFDEAEELFLKAVDLASDSPELRHNLRSLMTLQGRGEEARESFRKLLKERPELWTAEVGLARNLAKKGLFEDAMETFRDILALYPDDANVWNDIGAILLDLEKFDEAREILTRATELDPALPEAHNNLASVHLKTNRADLAVPIFKKALAARPDFVEPHVNLCRALRQLAEFDQANMFAHAALMLDKYQPKYFPNLVQVFRATCDFDGLEAAGNVWENCDQIASENLPGVFLDLLVFADDVDSVRRFRDLVLRWANFIERQAAAAPLPERGKRRSGSKLRVGLLSADLRSHSVARFLIPLLRNYDRERFELYCYTPVRHVGDPIQNLFMECVDKFTFVENVTEWEIANTIRTDEVDILLDLNGFTQGSRVASLAHKPAPVQISWLGYPFTCGLEAIDYVVMDRFVKPVDEEGRIEEPLIMPDAWACFGKFPNVPIEEGLPADRSGRITFGTLNNPYKYTQKMIALWSEVMNQVSNSDFLVVRPETRSLNFCKNLAEEFAKHGISPERLFLSDNRQEKKNHLYYYNDIDISLDTFPLTGGTTTCEALWMGVPVVTLVGESFHQRISYSNLMHCGLEELCTFTPENFVERAVALANEREILLAMRQGLREVMRQSPLCDEERFLYQFQEMLDQVADLHGLR